MDLIQCMKCGWADFGLSAQDARLKIEGHEVKTGCDGKLRVLKGKW